MTMLAQKNFNNIAKLNSHQTGGHPRRLSAFPLKSYSNKNTESISVKNLDKNNMDIFKAFVQSQSENPYENYMGVQKRSTLILDKLISSDIKNDINILKNHGKTSLIILKNAPVFYSKDNIPNTPKTDKRPKKDFTSEYFMLGLSGLLNSIPYVAETEKDGSVIQQVIPLNPKSISGLVLRFLLVCIQKTLMK